MKIFITEETCVAAQMCSNAAPRVFGNTDDGGFVELLNATPSDPADQAGARRAETFCPSSTIHIEETD